MGNFFFEVETYQVSITHVGVGSTGVIRRIFLTATPLWNGARSIVLIHFHPETPVSLGSVSNGHQADLLGVSVNANLTTADFALWYEVLRAEKPVHFFCNFADDEGSTGRSTPLFVVQLYTGTEPIGEGPGEMMTLTFPSPP